MKYTELITKLGKVVEESKLLIRVKENMIYIDAQFLYVDTLNRIQRLLQLYGECEWWIVPSDTLENAVMYKIKIFTIL